MNTARNDFLAVNTLRLAHDFLAAFTFDPAAAIKELKLNLGYMDEWEIQQWFDYLGELLVEEGCTAEEWRAIFKALEFLDDINVVG